MATLQELKNQIDAANELGVTNITKKGGTISSDATTAEIMAEIDNLPSGGGSAPTVVDEITWDGSTEGKESVELQTHEYTTTTFYKVSENVLPYFVTTTEGAELVNMYSYSANSSAAATITPVTLSTNGGVYFNDGNGEDLAIVAFGTADMSVLEQGEHPAVFTQGTWLCKFNGGEDYLTSITATAAGE